MSLDKLINEAISWEPFFNSLDKDNYNTIEKHITKVSHKCYPEPKNIFRALYLTKLQDIKVVILGQDPYFNPNQATGLSFSVPKTEKIPPSLSNIYKNLYKYKHIDKYPDHGCLDFWGYQGCLMLNTSLTVKLKSPNCYADIWREFTDSLIKYISNNCKNVCFVLWGSPALSKSNLIDKSKHKLIISSHPSGLSCNNKLNIYPAFNNNDHFKIINKYLKKKNKSPIIWKIA